MRKRVDFWLDENRPADIKVWKVVEKLRSKRVFSQTVKDGIMIMNQLLTGKTDLLFKRFPWIIDKVLQTYAPPPSASDTGDLEARIADQIKSALNEAMLHAPSLPATIPVAKSGTIGQGRAVVAPTFDDVDDDNTMIITKVEAPRVSMVDGLLAIVANGIQGKNHTADDNAKSIASRRMS